jgi:hypothetical protein
MKYEEGEKVFYLRVEGNKITTSGQRTIFSVEQVGGYIYVTLDDGNYFQLRPIDKDRPLMVNSVTDGVYEFLADNTKEGKKRIKHHLRSLAEVAVTQMAKYRRMKENLMSIVDDELTWLTM